MADKVTRLPDSMQRQWRTFEDSLRCVMPGFGVAPAEMDYVCAQIKPIYLRLAKSEKIHGGDNESLLTALNEWVFNQTMGFMLLLAEREVELFRLRGPK